MNPFSRLTDRIGAPRARRAFRRAPRLEVLEGRQLLTTVTPYVDYGIFTSAATISNGVTLGSGGLSFGNGDTDGVAFAANNAALGAENPGQPFVLGYISVYNIYTHAVGTVTSATLTVQVEFSVGGSGGPDVLKFTVPMSVKYTPVTVAPDPNPFTNHSVTVGAAAFTQSAVLAGTNLEFDILGLPTTISPAMDTSQEVPVMAEVKATVPPPSGVVQTVQWSGSSMITITKDSATGFGTNYTNPRYYDANLNGKTTDPGDHSDPVGYVAGSTASLKATFVLNAPDTDKNPAIEVKATGPNGLNVVATAAQLGPDQTTVTLNTTSLSIPFKANTINAYTPLTLTWQISTDAGKDWGPAGASQNPVYVTLAKPITDTDTPKIYESVIALSCINGKGATTANQAIPAIFGAFTSQNIKKVDGTPLVYYGSYRTANTTVEQLLHYGKAQCSAFVSLFLDMLKVQGIKQTKDYWTVEATHGAEGFFVNAWSFGTESTSGNPEFPYVNILGDAFAAKTLGNLSDYDGNTDYSFIEPEVTRNATAANNAVGQNNPNPASIFNNHQIAVLTVNGTQVFFDPSYGKTYTSLNDMSEKVVAGIYIHESNYRVWEPALPNGINLNGHTAKNGFVQVDAFLVQSTHGQPGFLNWSSKTSY